MIKVISSVLLLCFLTFGLFGCSHTYPVVYVNCLGSPIVHTGLLLKKDKTKITLIENKHMKTFSATFCGVVPTGRVGVY